MDDKASHPAGRIESPYLGGRAEFIRQLIVARVRFGGFNMPHKVVVQAAIEIADELELQAQPKVPA